MGPTVYLNGKLVPAEQASISIYDHGFLYGDGIFEGIRVYDRKVFKLREHVTRLFLSARAIAIELPMTQEEFVQAVLNVVRTNEVVDGYIRVSISRGPALGLDPRKCTQPPTIVISTDKLALYPKEMYEHGLEVVTCSTRVPPAQSIDPRIKSLGKYICNIMAKMEANRVNAGEGLMLNTEGYVAEATGDNVFVIKDGRIYTPPTSAGILEGITRDTVISLAKEDGYEVVEKMMTLFDIYTADECFLTGTAAEVIPMVKLDERTIGTGVPGVVTKKLMNAFHALTRKEGVPV
jgi:branched-chain amino acid aminotransferase